MKKKLLALILALAMVLSSPPAVTSPQTPPTTPTILRIKKPLIPCLQKVYVSTAQGGSLYYTVGIAITQLWTEKFRCSRLRQLQLRFCGKPESSHQWRDQPRHRAE